MDADSRTDKTGGDIAVDFTCTWSRSASVSPHKDRQRDPDTHHTTAIFIIRRRVHVRCVVYQREARQDSHELMAVGVPRKRFLGVQTCSPDLKRLSVRVLACTALWTGKIHRQGAMQWPLNTRFASYFHESSWGLSPQ